MPKGIGYSGQGVSTKAPVKKLKTPGMRLKKRLIKKMGS